MNDNEDIKKQLEVKNKEIYRNKLNLDVDNNLEVLVLTIDNLLNSMSKEGVKKILEIDEGIKHQKEVEQQIFNFIDLYREQLMNLFISKKDNLKETIIIDNNLDIYKDKLHDDYLNFENNLNLFSNKIITELENELKLFFEDKFKLKRLNDYLNNIFLVNLNNKTLDIVKTRDLILLNTFQETYLKYLELNRNTVGV